jgi:hypothetical protein
MKIKAGHILLFSLGFVLLVLVQPAFAMTVEQLDNVQVTGDFVVGPGKIELQLNPGEERQIEMTVTNRMGEDRIFLISTEDFEGTRNLNETVRLLGDEASPFTLKDNIIPERNSFVLKHGERARLPVRIKVAKNEDPGGKYATVLVSTISRDSTKPSADGATGGAAIIARIGTLFFVRIPGEVKQDSRLVDFEKAEGNILWSSPDEIRFRILTENNGSVHVNPYGQIRISNFFDAEIIRLKVDPWFVLPDSLRSREYTWKNPRLMGRYEVTAEVNRGYDGIVDEKQIVFYVIPLVPIIGVFVLIIALIFIVRWFFKSFEFKRKSS